MLNIDRIKLDIILEKQDEILSILSTKDENAAQRKKSKWVGSLVGDSTLYCHNCGQEHSKQEKIWKYCPNCGALMEKIELC